ncbi:hypothetical protein FOCC_FOCC016398 [Frankliniella occidentalis]|nr:hypothetical protein FOCC_FOCC016398 [Frankliniella occidentalis]
MLVVGGGNDKINSKFSRRIKAFFLFMRCDQNAMGVVVRFACRWCRVPGPVRSSGRSVGLVGVVLGRGRGRVRGRLGLGGGGGGGSGGGAGGHGLGQGQDVLAVLLFRVVLLEELLPLVGELLLHGLHDGADDHLLLLRALGALALQRVGHDGWVTEKQSPVKNVSSR